MVFFIINGKKSGLPELREAVHYFRQKDHDIQVRITWEFGDVDRFLLEAIEVGAKTVIIGGGDGSVNELVNAMLKHDIQKRLPIGIIPLGTANDFATAAGIPLQILPAFEFALNSTPIPIDAASANEHSFINMATAGFGAKVTAETPVDLKNFLGGGAYVLSGVIQALQFVPYSGEISTADKSFNTSAVVAAVGNGIQAGGGQQLCPNAKLNDGLLDLIIIEAFPAHEFGLVLQELRNEIDSDVYVKRVQTPWLKVRGDNEIPINLDGEPFNEKDIEIKVLPAAIDLLLPADSKLLS